MHSGIILQDEETLIQDIRRTIRLIHQEGSAVHFASLSSSSASASALFRQIRLQHITDEGRSASKRLRYASEHYIVIDAGYCGNKEIKA